MSWPDENTALGGGTADEPNFSIITSQDQGESEITGSPAAEICNQGISYPVGSDFIVIAVGERGTTNLEPFYAVTRFNANGNDLQADAVNSGTISLTNPSLIGSSSIESVAYLGESGSVMLLTTDVEGGADDNFDFLLVRLDAEFNEIWQFRFGGELNEKGSKVIQARDGGFVFLGTYTLRNAEMAALIKVTPDGELKNY